MQGWTFTDDRGAFRLENPHHTSYLYFPLVNEAGLVSAITPTLHGDVKTGQNSFLTPPVSVEDLHTSRAARNFWVWIEGYGAWSATGQSAAQVARRFTADDEPVALEAGPLWHRVVRELPGAGLRATVTTFVPASTGDAVELTRVTLTNTGDRSLSLVPTAAIPIFGRSADNLRDHRHVTSLLHRIAVHEHGVLVTPTLSFDERGHLPNELTYAVLGAADDGVGGDGAPPAGFFPVMEEFIGEGGTLDWPEAVVRHLPSGYGPGDRVAGYEAIGGLRFPEVHLEPGASCDAVLLLAVLRPGQEPAELLARYGSVARFDAWLERTTDHWAALLDRAACATGDRRFDGWLRWVALQPTLRRLCGNSFLPYHDYGRGGRGWRDLWQDILGLLIMAPDDVGETLLSHFAGVRLDGSNATIIGREPGEFRADRNDIPRVWMDHGAWPLLTVDLYLDQSGDLDFLRREQAYFKDHLIERAAGIDEAWAPAQGTRQRAASGEIYRGTVLEHLLVQHLVPFFHVGEHNIMRLEGADWNDGLDMAEERGESVAFTALYAGNLRRLSELALALAERGHDEGEIFEELGLLLDTLDAPVDYGDVAAKRARLAAYFAACRHAISGRRARVPLVDLARDLAAKADWLVAHLCRQEWVGDGAGRHWFNGYYDNAGRRVEGPHPEGARMTLTGQVFPLMGGVATPEQVGAVIAAAERYLYDPAVGGYRLNTDFGGVQLDLGRAFGFAYGHKENGAMFSHMAVMYAYALYRQGRAREGFRVLDEMYRQSQAFERSRMYPGLPEYFSERGRGMYPYLTGSASWYLLTLVTEAFGVRGRLGDLALRPRLAREQFDAAGRALIHCAFAGRQLAVTYHNAKGLDVGAYRVVGIRVNDRDVPFRLDAGGALLSRGEVAGAPAGRVRLDVTLAGRE